jgi:DNA polymerase III epsilon subunit-like protein
MARPWTASPIHFIDFEGSLGSGIVEFGVVTLYEGTISATRTGLCSPTGFLPPEDSDVHGLTPATLAGYPPFRSEWEYFAGLRQTGPFAAHFAGAENSLLKNVWPFARPSPDFVHGGEPTVEWGPWIDSARIYAQGGLAAGGSLRLATLVETAWLQPELNRLAALHCPPERCRYHAALYDALASALLVAALARDPRYAHLTLGHLVLLSTADPDKRAALIQPELY